MRIVYAFGLAGLLAVSCSTFNKKEEAKIAYERRIFKKASPGCKTDSTTCATYEISYPEFTGLDTAVLRILNEQLMKQIAGAPEDAPTRSIEAAADDFLADFDKTKAEMPDYGMGWYYKADARELVVTDSLISLQADADVFTGGAHGMFSTTFINVDAKTGAPYLLDSFLKPGYSSLLNQLGEEAFRKENEMADTTTLDAAGFEFPENKFQLNDNYGFRKEGIIFVFNSYEVAAYAVGPTEIIIPYEMLKGWFKGK